MSRLWIKLTLACLATALVAAGVVAVLAARSTGNQFRQYVVHSSMMATSPSLVQGLVDYYARQGSWEGIETAISDLAGSDQMGMMGRGRGRQGGLLTLADAEGRVVYDDTGQLMGRELSASALAQGFALTLPDGRRVGTLLAGGRAGMTLDVLGQDFLARVRRSLAWAGLVALAAALVMGVLISRRLTAPLRRLTDAAGDVASGNLSSRVAIEGRDEIGELGTAFNRMAGNLQEVETQRRNMMADVAHELRTPLTVIQGNLQAMLDDVYPLDQVQIAALYDETRLLTRLVEDLRDLALAEAGQLRLERAPTDVAALARSTAAGFAAAADTLGVTLSVKSPPGEAIVEADADRIGQVLRNLLSNALRHVSAGETVMVEVRPAEAGAPAEASAPAAVLLSVSDTGTGIAPQDLPHVFDRFYRGDKARRGSGAGLGLAITRQIVLAHGGEIAAASTPGQGATFTVRLPAAKA